MEEVGVPEHATAVLDSGREDAAGAGIGDVQELLHHGRGAANLVAGERAEAGSAEAAMQRILDRIGCGLVRRAAVRGQTREAGPRQPGVGEQPGGAPDRSGRHHRSLGHGRFLSGRSERRLVTGLI
jgi:hypothetical protein